MKYYTLMIALAMGLVLAASPVFADEVTSVIPDTGSGTDGSALDTGSAATSDGAQTVDPDDSESRNIPFHSFYGTFAEKDPNSQVFFIDLNRDPWELNLNKEGIIDDLPPDPPVDPPIIATDPVPSP